MFPLHDDNVRLHAPVGTWLIIALNVLVWALLQGFGSEQALARSLCLHGLIPGDLLGQVTAGTQIPLGPNLACVIDGNGSWFSLFSSMFMHGGWFHIIGNMWFLWVFGDNVEDVMGTARYLVFYLLSGLAAAGAQILTEPGSAVPMVGASGAIGGVLGAYARLYPRAHVHTLIFLGFYVTTVAVPAVFMLGYWFLIQLASGLADDGGAGVAFWAHAGGFGAGLLLSLLLVGPQRLAEHRDGQQRQLSSRHRWL
ncbi:MAG: Rhomboid protease GluP [Pseudomonadales bacterium]|nr:Rhomboid protease GluP [Pseudomonadales bacterium]